MRISLYKSHYFMTSFHWKYAIDRKAQSMQHSRCADVSYSLICNQMSTSRSEVFSKVRFRLKDLRLVAAPCWEHAPVGTTVG